MGGAQLRNRSLHKSYWAKLLGRSQLCIADLLFSIWSCVPKLVRPHGNSVILSPSPTFFMLLPILCKSSAVPVSRKPRTRKMAQTSARPMSSWCCGAWSCFEQWTLLLSPLTHASSFGAYVRILGLVLAFTVVYPCNHRYLSWNNWYPSARWEQRATRYVLPLSQNFASHPRYLQEWRQDN